MIEIAVIKNNQEYPLLFDKEPSFPVEEFESLFYTDVAIKGGFSIGLKIPIKGNQMTLDFADAIAVRDDMYFFDIRIYSNGQLTNEATMTIEEASIDWNSGYYDADIVLLQYSTRIEGKTLRDVMKTEVVLGYEPAEMFLTITTDYVGSTWPTVPVQFPELRVSDKDGESIIYANKWNHVTNSMVEDVDANTDFSMPVMPQVYLAQAIKECFSFFGYKITGEALSEKWFTIPLLAGYFPLLVAKRQNEQEYVSNVDQTFGTTPSYSYWHEEVFNNSLNVVTLPTPAIFTPLTGVFVVKLKLVVKSISPGAKIKIQKDAVTTVEIPFNAFAGDTIEYSYYINSVSADYIMFVPIGVTVGELVLGAGTTLNIYEAQTVPPYEWFPQNKKHLINSFVTGDCVPDGITVADFLKSVKKAFQVKFAINEVLKTVEIRTGAHLKAASTQHKIEHVIYPIKKLLANNKKFVVKWGNEPSDIDEYYYLGATPLKSDLVNSTPGSAVLVLSENAYYVCNESGAWEWLMSRSYSLEIGEGDIVEEINLDFKLVDMQSDARGVLPTLFHNEQGNFTGWKGGDWDLMLMSYYGIVENGAGDKPFASSSPYAPDGVAANSAYLFLDNGADSIFSTNLKPWLSVLSQQTGAIIKVARPYFLTMNEISGKRIYFEGNEFLIKRTAGEPGEKDTQTEIEMIKL